MACITASGELLPPFVVYRAQNVYKNWVTGGPSGTKYAATKNEWFETNTFERWFFEILFLMHKNEWYKIRITFFTRSYKYMPGEQRLFYNCATKLHSFDLAPRFGCVQTYEDEMG